MSPQADSLDRVRIAFMCVRNAGRSQVSTAIAKREQKRRGLEDRVDILTGGTHPADHVHPGVIAVMDEVGVDLSGRSPREITLEELQSSDYVVTMGCSTLAIGEVGDNAEVREWALEDPDGKNLDRVREIRDDIEQRVTDLFNEFSEPR